MATIVNAALDSERRAGCMSAAGKPDKAFATLAAEAALLGITLQRFPDAGAERYSVSRWGKSRDFDTLDEVLQLLEVMTGARFGGGDDTDLKGM